MLSAFCQQIRFSNSNSKWTGYFLKNGIYRNTLKNREFDNEVVMTERRSNASPPEFLGSNLGCLASPYLA